jgi:hypothetical protein
MCSNGCLRWSIEVKLNRCLGGERGGEHLIYIMGEEYGQPEAWRREWSLRVQKKIKFVRVRYHNNLKTRIPSIPTLETIKNYSIHQKS